MGLLGSAASGAAAGTAISPGLGTVIGAGIGGLASIVGGIFGNKSVSNTNKTNLQIAREQNAFNLEQWNRERDFTVDMWSRQNAYNDPSAQKSRLLAAGINPYLANIDAGAAQSAATPAGSPAAGATMQPKNFDYIGEGVNGAVSNYIMMRRADAELQQMDAQNELLKQQAKEKSISNLYQDLFWTAQIDKFKAEAEHSKNLSYSEFQRHTLFPELYKQAVADTSQKELGVTAMQYQIGLQDIQLKLAHLDLQWMPEMKRQEFKIALADEMMKRSATSANYASSRASLSQAAYYAAQKAGVDINNSHLEEMLPKLRTAQDYANTKAEQEEFIRTHSVEFRRAKLADRRNAAGRFIYDSFDNVGAHLELLNPFRKLFK